MQNPFFSGGLTLMLVGALMALLRNLPGTAWGWLVHWVTISVEIPDRDPAFRWVQSWIVNQRHAGRARRLSVTTTWDDPDPDPTTYTDPDYRFTSGRVSEARFILSPAPGMHLMKYRGRLVLLRRARRELQSGGPLAFQETLTLQIIGGNRALVDALLNEAHKTALPRIPGVNILTGRHENWNTCSWRPRRPLASIVLADNMLEEILADLRTFLDAGAWYMRRGVPHRRGYLLHGPPGNGKTTLVAAVAGELGLSVAVLSLNSKTLTDEALRNQVNALPSGAVLLIEDIDCAFAEKRAGGEVSGVTMSGLLNALDGVSSREGRVLFLTTNHPERLDPALIRPGRVDRCFRLGNTTSDQARRLFAWFYANGNDHGNGQPDPEVERWAGEFAARVPDGQVCMAAIQEHLLRYRNDPESAVRALDEAPLEGQAEREALTPDWSGVEKTPFLTLRGQISCAAPELYGNPGGPLVG
jgi:chaperone BCS1